MKIGIASDHAGYELKAAIIAQMQKSAYDLIDYGCDNAKDAVDYPDFANKLCGELIKGKIKFGILICGSGIGISIAANRFKQVRAALCYNQKMAQLARKHNDANVICLGGRITKQKAAIKIILHFLNTDFEGGRHNKRVIKLGKGC